MPKTIHKVPTAVFVAHKEVVAANGEIHMNSRHGSDVLDQTLSCIPPSAIFFSPSSQNFYLVALETLGDDWELVSIVRDIS